MNRRAGVAEFVGTALLLFVVVGSGIVVDRLGNDGAEKLFAHAVVVGLSLAALIAMFTDVSGAHFNPLVTTALWKRGDLGGRQAGFYLVAQLLGAIFGTVVAHLSFEHWGLAIASNSRGGWGKALAELIGTFGLVLLILGLSNGGKGAWIPAAVGAWVTAMIFSTASAGFLNPAVTVARTLSDTYTGISPRNVPAFLFAQAIGAATASFLADRLFPPTETKGI